MILSNVLSGIEHHFSHLYTQADPLQEVSAFPCNKRKSSKWQNSVPIVVMLLGTIYGTIVLPYEALGYLPFQDLSSNAFMFTHQIVPRSIWSIIDIGFVIDITCTALVFAVLLLTPQAEDQFKIYVQDNGKLTIGSQVLCKNESKKLLSKQKRIKIIFLYLFSITFWLILTGYFMVHVFVINRQFKVSPCSLLFWAVFLLYNFYIIYAILDSIVYVILASSYIQTCQQKLLYKLTWLNARLNQVTVNSGIKVWMYWGKFMRVNAQTVRLGRLTTEYSRVCDPLLSVVVPWYITIQCYMLYITLFTHSISLRQKQMFTFDILEMDLFLFVIIDQCARVVKLNQAIERQNRVFYLNLCPIVRNGRKLLKGEMFQANRRLHSYAFRILGHYRITAKSYFLIVSYICTFFIFVSKQKY